jgi:HEPN domain-containing protein
MKAPDRAVVDKVLKWLNYGDEDLRLARHGLSLSSYCPYRLIAFHAQQCAEKHLKAYLVFRGIDFPYTHNISRLLELCGDEAPWAESLLDAEELSPFATTVRYPGEEEEVSEEEAIQAINIAAKVYEVVREALKQDGVKFPKAL